MDLEKQAAARSDSLVMVLQDRVSGGQAHPESLQEDFYPLSMHDSVRQNHTDCIWGQGNSKLELWGTAQV